MNAHSETRQWTEEDYLHEQLRMLQLNYEKAAKPIIDRLVRIRSMDTNPSILVSIDQLPADWCAAITKTEGK